MNSSNNLQIKNLSKTFSNGMETLRDINLEINKGEFVSIIGPSGCGKSTLFHILAGLDTQTSGEILGYTGRFGYMPQDPSLLPHKTVLENLLLGPDILGISRKKSYKNALEVLHHFHLEKFAHAYPKILSGGMSQRIAFLRTILFNKDFLLLDEPFGALDSLVRISCQTWLQNTWSQYKSSVLFITHDIREAIFLSDTIYVLSSRPAKIIAKIEVTLPRPRKPEDISLPKAILLEKKLMSLLLNKRTI